MEQLRKKIQQLEIRVKENGELLLKGSIPYFSLSDIMYSRQKQGLMIERIAPFAFGNILSKSNHVPKLLINHQYNREQRVKDFAWEDTEREFCFEFTIEPTEDLLQSLDHIGAISFGFLEGESQWKDVRNNDKRSCDWERTLISFKEVREISILINQQPAYPCAKIYIAENTMPLSDCERDAFIQDIKESIRQLRRKEFEELQKVVSRLREMA